MPGQSNIEKVGRFDYVEPMNMNLDRPDNAVVYNPEDYNISVNLEVEIPSRIYAENNEVKLVASSDNGSISFFGGTNIINDKESNSIERGYLTTSWTDISVHDVNGGNKECLGIESINIAYSPNFFPIVTIRFVDVRGASLFTAQEEAYQQWVQKNDFDPKNAFDGASFFKSLFSMPSPIFKLTVKGFYGKPVTYKLVMSKFSSDFDSESGNFIANVEFAGYMYGIYTELPMSFIALAPYLDGLKYWQKRNFTFKNGVQMPTIPELVEAIGTAIKKAPQVALESKQGKDFTEANNKLTLLKSVRDNFPFKNWIKSEGEVSTESKRGIGFADANLDIITKEGLTPEGADKNNNWNNPIVKQEVKNLDNVLTDSEERQVYYYIPNDFSNGNFKPGSNVSSPIDYDTDLFTMANQAVVENYKELLQQLIDNYGSGYQKYLDDFNMLLKHTEYDREIYRNGEKTHACLPVMCAFVTDGYNNFQVRGIDFFNQDKIKKTYYVTYLGFQIKKENKVEECKPDDIRKILEKCNRNTGFEQGKTAKIIFRIRTNILKWIDEELSTLEKDVEEKKQDLYEEQIALSQSLIGYPLTIENVYSIIFAHIDTFMERYYGHLKNLTNDINRTKLLTDRFETIIDVPSKYKDDGTIPPFPCFIEKNGDKQELVWPPKVLNDADFEETEFVYEIVDAALQVGNRLKEAIEQIKIAGEGGSGSNGSYGDNGDYTVSVPTNTKTILPSTPFDMLFNNTNPYQKLYDEYKSNAQPGVVKKIWFVFMFRCAYFAMMYRKYRITVNYENSKDKQTTEKFSECAEKYFAMCEASNIKKAFGENIAIDVIKNLDVDGAEDEFMKLVGEFIQGSQTNGEYQGLSKMSEQNFGWENVNFSTPFKKDEYTILPTKYFNKEKIENDVKNNAFLDDSENYVVFLNNGHIIENEVSAHTLNKNTIRILPSNYFTTYRNLVKSDSLIQELFTMDGDKENLDLFLEDFLGTNEWGKTDYVGSRVGSKREIVPYGWVNFNDGTKDKHSNDIIKEQIAKSGAISLEKAVSGKEKPVKYTSIINNMCCIDPVNVISNGCTEEDTSKHFAVDSSQKINITKFLKDGADVFTKAYLFLFSIPLVKGYLEESCLSNMQIVLKTALLKEGAFYYWQKNYQTIKQQFNENYGNGMERDNIPIVKREETAKPGVNQPCLWMSNNVNNEYLTWDNLFYSGATKVSQNRREFLINYFMDWAKGEEFANISLMKSDVNGLTQSDMNKVINFYFDEYIYFDYSDVLDRNMYSSENDKKGKMAFSDKKMNFFKETYTHFKKYIDFLFPDEQVLTPSSAAESVLSDITNGVKSSEDLKLSVYLTLQSLYTKFIANSNRKRWEFNGSDSDFKNFYYMDAYYHKIGDKLLVNGTKLESMLGNISDTVLALTNSETDGFKGSVYEFFAQICQDNGLNLLALPIHPFTIEKEEEKVVWKLFDTIPYNRMDLSKETSCFISMYTYRPSEHLNLPDKNGLMGYTNDGFDINLNGEKDLPKSLQDFGDTDAPRIPAFAVTYAKQNQSIFKKINVSTTNPQITEASISMTLNIASKSDSNPRDSVFFGQDMYSVYSNYSYTCDVEMMGCAPIMPLMYFQLNNIPMFKGAYMIINVEHNIVAGNMTTRFKGVRVSKNSIPFVKATYIYTDDLGNPHYGNDSDSNDYKQGEPLSQGGTGQDNRKSTTKPTNIKGKETSDIITEKNPLVCLTPAHGPKIKSLENAWSTKVVERIIEKIDDFNKGKDEKNAIHYQYCNQNGRHTTASGYSMTETSGLIETYGSEKVISLVPHWNGGAGNYYVAMTGGGKHHKPQRQDSLQLCQCVVNEAKKAKESLNFYHMFDGHVSIWELAETKSDGAAQLDCACVLSENWFADYNSKDSNKWAKEPPDSTTGRYWLESEEGIETIATIHFNAIVDYIDILNNQS